MLVLLLLLLLLLLLTSLLQLKHGAKNGRLVWCGHWGVYNSSQAWYSDDGGDSYTLSKTVFMTQDECTLAELDDGTVYWNMRNTKLERGYARSTDGGETFGKVVHSI